MTLKQRELEKILREELKARREAGERNIKIKDGKIIRTGPVEEGAVALVLSLKPCKNHICISLHNLCLNM